MEQVVPAQVAEVLATGSDGGLTYGSGYRIGPKLVLTCAHVLPEEPGHAEYRIRLGGGRAGEFTAQLCWNGNDHGVDVALLRLDGADAGECRRARLGAFAERSGNPRPCVAVGYPRSNLRPNGGPRDSHEARGELRLASGNKTGLLEFVVAGGEPRDVGDGPDSYWHGFSGSAVFTGELLVAVASDHLGTAGPGRLDAVAVKDAYDADATFRELLAEDGIGDPVVLRGQRTDPIDGTADWRLRAVLSSTVARWRPFSPLLPPDVDVNELHQPVRVRPVGHGDRDGSVALTPMVVQEPSWGEQRNKAPERAEQDAWLWEPDQITWSNVLIRGRPGYGKTWLLRHHAATLAERSLAQLDSGAAVDTVPLYIEATAFGGRLPDDPGRHEVWTALARSLTREPAAGGARLDEADALAVIEDAAASGRLSICLDALDEVPVSRQNRVYLAISWLEADNCRLVLSARPSASALPLEPRPERVEVALLGFETYRDIRRFVRAWFHGTARRAEAVERVLQDARVRDLAKVPLFAALLCHLYGAQRTPQTLPATPTGLAYEAAMSLLSGRPHDTAARRAIDAANPPDSRLRLTVLADALSTTAEGWRSPIEPLSRRELRRALQEHPDHQVLQASAEYRAAAMGRTGPADAVWEYLLDGLLVTDDSSDHEQTLRFVHRVFGSLCLAVHYARLPEEQQWEVLEEHRWFDGEWDEVIPMLTVFSPHRDDFVRRLLETPDDAFGEQRLLAARCIAADPAKFAQETADATTAEVVKLVHSPRHFDRVRALSVLRMLVGVGVPAAKDAALALLADEQVVGSVRNHIVVTLAHVKDPAGLDTAAKLLSDTGGSLTDRLACGEALVLARRAEGVAMVCEALSAERDGYNRLVLAGALTVGDEAEIAAASEFVDDHGRDRYARGAVAIALAGSGALGADRAAQLIDDPTLAWSDRARVGAARVQSGQPLGRPALDRLVGNPNLRAADRALLLLALLRRGGTEVIDESLEVIGSDHVEWLTRKRLAEALARLGEPGRTALRSFAARGNVATALRLRAIDALVEVGDAEAERLAADWTAEEKVPAWIRCRLASALLRNGHCVPDGIVDTLLATAKGERRLEFVQALALSGASRAENVAVELLHAVADERSEMTLSPGTVVEDLAKGGQYGIAALRKVAAEQDVDIAVRYLAIVALAVWDRSGGTPAGRWLAGDSDPTLRLRLAVTLGRFGVEAAFEPLLDLLSTAKAMVYAPLYQFLSAPSTTAEMVDRARAPVAALMAESPAPQRQSPMIGLGPDLLRSRGIVFRTRAEGDALTRRLYDELELAVGESLFRFMFNYEAEEFEQYADADDGRAIQFLEVLHPNHGDVVRAELDRLIEEYRIRYGKRQADSLPTEPITRLARVSHDVDEWMRMGMGPDHVYDLAASRRALFVLPALRQGTLTGLNLLKLASEMTTEWPKYEAHWYLLDLVREFGPISAYNIAVDTGALLDRLRRHLAAGNEFKLLNGGCLGIMVHHSRDVRVPFYFYAALGAALRGSWTWAADLMGKAAKGASPGQRAAGMATIEEVTQMHGLDRERMAALADLLANGPQEE